MQTLDNTLAKTHLLRDNNHRGKLIYIMMWMLIPLTLLGILSDYQEYRLISKAMDGAFISTAEAAANDNRQMIVGLLMLGFNVALIVSFIQWFRRAYYNAHALQIPFLSYNEGRAAGSWFIPFANLYQPYKIATEIWDGFHYALEKWIPGHLTPGRAFIVIWWLLFIVTNFIGNLVSRFYIGSDTIGELHTASLFNMYSGIIGITAIIAVLYYIRKMRHLEKQLQQAASEQANHPLPWVAE